MVTNNQQGLDVPTLLTSDSGSQPLLQLSKCAPSQQAADRHPNRDAQTHLDAARLLRGTARVPPQTPPQTHTWIAVFPRARARPSKPASHLAGKRQIRFSLSPSDPGGRPEDATGKAGAWRGPRPDCPSPQTGAEDISAPKCRAERARRGRAGGKAWSRVFALKPRAGDPGRGRHLKPHINFWLLGAMRSGPALSVPLGRWRGL